MLKIKNQPQYNTVLISADSQEELAKTFIRFQEHYESPNPEFRGQIFTLGSFKSWYSEYYGGDTYYQDWKGFNFPSKVLLPFRQGLFDPLTNYEISFLNLLKYRHDDFYIIGANDDSIIRHELAHALYYCSDQYKKEIDRFLSNNKKSLYKIKRYLLTKGYCKEVLNDEIQAYITDNDEDTNKMIPSFIREGVNQIFNNHTLEKSLK